MIEIGTKVRVFKEKNNDTYHNNQGEWKFGTVIARYENYYSVKMDKGKYRESFKESEMEVISNVNDIKSE